MRVGAPAVPRPFPEEQFGELDWRQFPIIAFTEADQLVPSQDGLSFERLHELLGGAVPEGGDKYGKVLKYQGVRYIFDGHHRWLIALMRQRPFYARYYAFS